MHHHSSDTYNNNRVVRRVSIAGVSLRTNLMYVSVILIIVVFVGSAINYRGAKFSRVSKYAKMNLKSCNHEMFDRNSPNTLLCCDDNPQWMCLAAQDQFTQLLSSRLAFVLPLIPWIFNSSYDLWYYGSKGINLAGQRLSIHMTLILLRTFVLYAFAEFILHPNQPQHSCWYVEFTRDKKCRDYFDFSDHIVLFYGQYILPAIIEFTYASISFGTGSNNWVFYISTLLSSSAIFIYSRCILFTTLFFHTPLESIVATVLVLIVSGGLIYSYANSNLWKKLFLI